MNNIETGGPAFPGLNAEFTGISSDGQERYEIQPSGGMTIRDYFAAHATDEDIADALALVPKVDRVVNDFDGRRRVVAGLPQNARQIARYIHADAMLRAREAS